MKSIIKHKLYIKHFLSAVESHLTPCFIPMDQPRRSDCFCLTLSGSCKYTMDDGRVFDVQAGDILYLAKGNDYSMEIASEHYHYIVCNFLFNDSCPRLNLHFKSKNPLSFEKEFRKTVQNFSIHGPDWWISCIGQLYKIYAMLVREQQTEYVPSAAKASIINSRVWIRTHLDDPALSVSFLAQQANMSEVHFRELFRHIFHTTPAKFITQERIAYAKQLMELKELRLEDIALQSGFSSLPYFCKVFKATTGTTPAVYRSKIR